MGGDFEGQDKEFTHSDWAIRKYWGFLRKSVAGGMLE